MASANSLLGLVNQLQSMEHHFTSILLETVLKLTSLTDAKVFVLVESQDCRRIAGAEYLCRSFVDGQLQPVASDRQVHLQPDVCALTEDLISSNVGEDFDSEIRVMSIHAANGTSPHHSGRKRPPNGGFPRHSRGPKERRMNQAIKQDPDGSAYRPSDLNAENETGGGDPNSENGVLNDSNDAGGGEDFPVEDDSFAEVSFSKPDGAPIRDDVGDDGTFSQNNGALVPVAPAMDHDFSFIEEFMRTNHKVGPVLSIYDESVTEKNSVSNKVTLSLIYDFAKCLFSNCAYASFKDWGFREFFEAAFEKFWNNFPNFAVWESNHMRFQERVDKRTNMCRMATPKSFLRQKIRINVINLMLTKAKPSGNAGNRAAKKSLPLF